MKTFGKVLLGIVAVVALGIAAVFFFTADMARTADGFFKAVKADDMDSAFTYLSADFKAGTSEQALRDYLAANALDDFKEASWGSRSINGSRGSLVGSVTTRSGGVVPITLSFVKADSGWKIYSIQKPASGIQEEISGPRLPPEQELVKLVADAMLVFAESVNEKSMAKFHRHVSNLLQQQYSVTQLDEAYASFYDLGADLTVLKGYSPQFDTPPAVDGDGVLRIKGRYATQPNSVYFEQSYIYEGLGWKILGFNIQVK